MMTRNEMFISYLIGLGYRTRGFPIISPAGKWIFNQCPKCASRAMHQAFRDLGVQTVHGEAAMGFLQNLSHKDGIDDYFIFSFVRNPYDRAVSLCHHFGFEWEDFIKGIPTGYRKRATITKDFEIINWPNIAMHCQPQTHYTHINGECMMDFIGHYENMEQDWHRLLQTLRMPMKELEWKNEWKSGHEPYLEYYQHGEGWPIYQFYEDDFKLLGYNRMEETWLSQDVQYS